MRDAGVLKLVTSPVLSPAGAGSEIELMFGRAPATGADGYEVHDLVPVTRSGLLYDVHPVMLTWICFDLMQTVGK